MFGCLCSVTPAFGTGDASMGSCPLAESSPGFRAFMADCRAYEMITPTYSGGAAAILEAVSPDGERVIVRSSAGFAENEDLEDSEGETGSFYMLSRTPGAWTAESLNPPTSLFTRLHYAKFDSTTLNRALYKAIPAHGAGEVNLPVGYAGWDLAVREAAGGAGRFTLLGPMLAPGYEVGGSDQLFEDYAYLVVGASADLSRVFFLVRAEDKQTWPGDKTAADDQSLYEYPLAEGKEPRLVGVSNEAQLAGNPNVNDGARLESDCGTALDGVSGAGEAVTVYFTALHVEGCAAAQPPVDELYARIDGARTVKISGAEPAKFQGASEDGTKVFFSEAGKLYEYVMAEEKAVLLASNIAGTAVVSHDGSKVYFSSPEKLTGESEPNGNGETAGEVPGEKLYVYDTVAGQTGLAFVAGEASPLPTTRDGSYIVLASARDLIGTNDHSSPVGQLFEYDALTRKVERVSVGQKSRTGYECPATKTIEAGYDCDGNTENESDAPEAQHFAPTDTEQFTGFIGDSAQPQGAATDLAVAEDGVVAFESPLALTPQASPGAANAYEFRAGQVYLVSPAIASVYGFDNPIVDESGLNIFFGSTEGLVPQDTDAGSQASVFDARVEGGFPAPPLAPSCAGEACQGPSGVAPVFGAAGTSAVGASGNLAPPVEPAPPVKPKVVAKRCKKGFVKRKGKCVKAKKAKKAA